MSSRLNPAAEQAIQVMYLDSQTQSLVRACVTKYTYPHHLGEKALWAIQRIGNFIKGVLGFSDWQVTHKAMQKCAMQIVEKDQDRVIQTAQRKGLFKKDERGARLAHFKQTVQQGYVNSVDQATEQLLSLCLLSQEHNPAISKDLKTQFHQLDLKAFVKKIGDALVAKLINKSLS